MILEAAQSCILQVGFARTRMEDIARASGLSRPLLYRHFKNKEAVLVGLAEHVTQTSLRAADEILAGPEDLWTRLAAAFDAWTEQHFRFIDSPYASEFLEADKSAVRPPVERAYVALAQSLSDAFRRADEKREIDLSLAGQTPELVSDLLMATHMGLKNRHLTRAKYNQRIRAFLQVLSQAIGTAERH